MDIREKCNGQKLELPHIKLSEALITMPNGLTCHQLYGGIARIVCSAIEANLRINKISYVHQFVNEMPHFKCKRSRDNE